MKSSSLIRLAGTALLAAFLGGCLQPVHAPRLANGQSSAASQLSQVSVDRIEGYLGYQLQSELNFLLTGGNAPTKAGRYVLKVKTQQSKASSIIDSSTGRAQIATLQIEAVYVLIDQSQGGKIRTSGKTFASASFDRSQMRFASMRAERDAEETVEFLAIAKEIAHYHHEKWDGSGYPQGLAGDQIPVSARLMAVADVYDALINKRVYKAAFSHDQACSTIVKGKGTHFDPDMVDAFVSIAEDFRSIALKYPDPE